MTTQRTKVKRLVNPRMDGLVFETVLIHGPEAADIYHYIQRLEERITELEEGKHGDK